MRLKKYLITIVSVNTPYPIYYEIIVIIASTRSVRSSVYASQAFVSFAPQHTPAYDMSNNIGMS